MQPVVVHDGLAAALFWISAGGWAAGEAFAFARSRRLAETQPGLEASQILLTASTLSGLGLGYYVATEEIGPGLPGGGWWPVVTGLLTLLAGLGLRAWAIRTLGRFFQFRVVVQEGQGVIDTGPYRRIRHPSYTGLLVGMLGAGIALDNAVSIACCLLPPLVGFVWRLLTEEAVLARELGEPYRDYMGHTERLVPGVW